MVATDVAGKAGSDLRHVMLNGRRRLIGAFCGVGLIGAVALFSVVREQAAFYRVTTLPPYRGYLFWPIAMNDQGQIVGYWFDGTKFTVLLWSRQSGLRDLGITSDSTLAINNSGQIAGTMTDPNGNTMVFLWDPRTGLAHFDCRNMSNIMPILIGPEGQIVGTFDGRSRHAYVWDHAGRMTDLNPLNAQMSWVCRSNESGQILGAFFDGNSSRSCLWNLADANSPEWVPLPGQDDAYCDLNNGGHVLRAMFRPSESPNQRPQKWAMLWHEDRGRTWLFPLPDLDADVEYVNDANQVVHYRKSRSIFTKWFPRLFPARWHSFLWDPVHGSISLDKALGLRGSEQLFIEDVNDEGCIVGTIWSGHVPKRSVLLEPIAGKWRR